MKPQSIASIAKNPSITTHTLEKKQKTVENVPHPFLIHENVNLSQSLERSVSREQSEFNVTFDSQSQAQFPSVKLTLSSLESTISCEFEDAFFLLNNIHLDKNAWMTIDFTFKELLKQKKYLHAIELLRSVIQRLMVKQKGTECENSYQPSSNFSKILLNAIKTNNYPLNTDLKTDLSNPVFECYGKFFDLIQAISCQKPIDIFVHENLLECAIDLTQILNLLKPSDKTQCLNFLKGSIHLLFPIPEDLVSYQEKLQDYKPKSENFLITDNNNTNVQVKNIFNVKFEELDINEWCKFWPKNNANLIWQQNAKKKNVWDQWCTFAMDEKRVKGDHIQDLLIIWSKALPLAQYIANNSPIELFKRSNMKIFLNNAVMYPKEMEIFYKSLLAACVDFEKKHRQKNQKFSDKIVQLLEFHVVFCERYHIRRCAILENESELCSLLDKVPPEAFSAIYSIFLNQLEDDICHPKLEKLFLNNIKDVFRESNDGTTLLKIAQLWRNCHHANPDKFLEVASDLSKIENQEAANESLNFLMKYSKPFKTNEIRLVKELISKSSEETREVFYTWLLTANISQENKIEIFVELMKVLLNSSDIYEISTKIKRVYKNLTKNNKIKELILDYSVNAFTHIFKNIGPNTNREAEAIYLLLDAIGFPIDTISLVENLKKFSYDQIVFENLMQYIRNYGHFGHNRHEAFNGNSPLILCTLALQLLKSQVNDSNFPLLLEKFVSSCLHLNCDAQTKLTIFKSIFIFYLEHTEKIKMEISNDPIFWKLCYLSSGTINKAKADFPMDITDALINECKIKADVLHSIVEELIKIDSTKSLLFALWLFINSRDVEYKDNINLYLETVLKLARAFHKVPLKNYDLMYTVNRLLISLMGNMNRKVPQLLPWSGSINDKKNEIAWMDSVNKSNVIEIANTIFELIQKHISEKLESQTFLTMNDFNFLANLLIHCATFFRYFNYIKIFKNNKLIYLNNIISIQTSIFKLLNAISSEKTDVKIDVTHILKLFVYMSRLAICDKMHKKTYYDEKSRESCLDAYVNIWMNHLKLLNEFPLMNDLPKNHKELVSLPLSRYVQAYTFLSNEKHKDAEEFHKLLISTFEILPNYILKDLPIASFRPSDMEIPNFIASSQLLLNQIKTRTINSPSLIFSMFYIFLFLTDNQTQSLMAKNDTGYHQILEKTKEETMPGFDSHLPLIRKFVTGVFCQIFETQDFLIQSYLENHDIRAKKILYDNLFDVIFFTLYFDIHGLFDANDSTYLDSIIKVQSVIKVSEQNLETFTRFFFLFINFKYLKLDLDFLNFDSISEETFSKICFIFQFFLDELIDNFEAFIFEDQLKAVEFLELIDPKIGIIDKFVSACPRTTLEKTQLQNSIFKWNKCKTNLLNKISQ